MNIVAWILSGVLAAVYLLVGIGKIVTPRAKLNEQPRMGWTNDFSASQIKGIGSAEVLGAIGLIVPWLTGIAPFLTPIAAVGLFILQIGAMVTHLRRGEKQVVPGNASLAALALVVAILRFIQL